MLKLQRLDKTHWRMWEEDKIFRMEGKTFLQPGIDDVFVEDILYHTWEWYGFKETDIDLAMEDLALYEHHIAVFKSNGKYCYTLTKEEWEKNV